MLIAFDIGNTTTAIGLFDGKRLVQTWRISSDREKTADEYGLILRSLLDVSRQALSVVREAILSSVVPPLTPVFQSLAAALFKVKALVVGPGLRTGMPILYDAPLEVGADRIAAAVAAYEK